MAANVTGQQYANITTNTTTTVKSSAGTLVGITINTAASGTATITVYDNTAGSGTKIGTINSAATTLPASLRYELDFKTGLTLVTAASVAAADITVTYL